MIGPLIRELGRALLRVALLLPLLIPVAEAAEAERVVIIHSFGRGFAPYNAIGVTHRTDLTRLTLVFRDASLDVERGGAPKDERLLVDHFLRVSDSGKAGAPEML